MAKAKRLEVDDRLLGSANIADRIDKDWLTEIGMKVLDDLHIDEKSRQEWKAMADKSLELAKLKREMKNEPWPKAANVKYPLTTTAAIQFAARTLPEIVKNEQVVRVAVNGEKTEEKEMRAKRVAKHMSYQLLVESEDWMSSTDKMLHMLAITGITHRKTFYDPAQERTVSQICTHDELVLHNDIKDLESARRISHIIQMHQNELIEKMRMGMFTKMDVDELRDNDQDDLKQHEIVEQHRYLDLDRDGYEEPYIVTVHRGSRKVLRIVARFNEEGITRNNDNEIIRIEPIHFFTDYHLIPSMDGSYHSLGFGTLMLSLNETVNTTINQLLDAGTLANMQGGFIGKGLRLKNKNMKFRPGEWKHVDFGLGTDIARNIVPLNYKEPSTVLFQLLGTLIEVGKDISSVTDVLSGKQPAQNVPATTILALVEQGQKVFSAIQQRLFISFKKEFKKVYRFNRLFLDPKEYFKFGDTEEYILQEDYEDESLDITPVADPRLSSDTQRLARSEALLQLMASQAPELDRREIIKRYLQDLDISDIDKLMPEPDPNAPPPPELIEMQSEIDERGKKLELKARELDIKEQQMAIQMEKTRAEIAQMTADAIDKIASAESREVGNQLQLYKTEVDALSTKADLAKELNSDTPNRAKGEVENVASELTPLDEGSDDEGAV